MNTYFEIFKVLLDLEFEKFEWCNFVYNFGSNILLLLYVDDIVIFGKAYKHINKILNLLKGSFDLKVLGETRKLLGVEFEEHKGETHSTSVVIHQINYIEEVYDLLISLSFISLLFP